MRPLEPVLGGPIEAPALVLEASISFWGGVDYETGLVIDKSHPQEGSSITGTCLIVPMIRGSGSTVGSLTDLLRRGLGPAGIVIGYPDINVMTGLKVAAHLYGAVCPLFLADAEQLAEFRSGAAVQVSADGQWGMG